MVGFTSKKKNKKINRLRRRSRRSKKRITKVGGSKSPSMLNPPETCEINKVIWILWLQGWDKAPWLANMVKESWIYKNPRWNVVLLSEGNLQDYTDDIEYIKRPTLTSQAKSDIIRLSILNKHGGVWADATLLCTQPLDMWVCKSLEQCGFWMYHGSDWGADVNHGPASWFIVSRAGSYIISKWKAACDRYWAERHTAHMYLWMDELFKIEYNKDEQFRKNWDSIENIDCESNMQPHMFSDGSWKQNILETKIKLITTPPRVIKLWMKPWEMEFPDLKSDKCIKSNGYFAIVFAKSGEKSII